MTVALLPVIPLFISVQLLLEGQRCLQNQINGLYFYYLGKYDTQSSFEVLRRALQLSTSHTVSINCRCRARVGGLEQLERSIKLLAWTYSSSHLVLSTMLQELSTFIGLAGLLLKMAAGFSSITSSG